MGESGDTPDPGKGLRPLHSSLICCLLDEKQWRIWGHPRPRQRAAPSALLFDLLSPWREKELFGDTPGKRLRPLHSLTSVLQCRDTTVELYVRSMRQGR